MVDRAGTHQKTLGRAQIGLATSNGGGASLVAMINPSSPSGTLGSKSHLPSKMLGSSRDFGALPIGSKKNSGAATYARGKQDLQGMALIMNGEK